MASQKHVGIVGAGVIGLCTAYYALQKGHKVTILERGGPERESCSFGNAGMVVPSHFVPLAAPGMVGMGLRMLPNPESPFAVAPKLDADLIRWGMLFVKAANAAHVRRSAPLLRDLNVASRACYEQLSQDLPGGFGLTQNGLLMLCKTQHALDEEAGMAAQARQLGLAAEVLDREETARKDPDVRMDVAGSVYFPTDCHLTPSVFMEKIAEAVRSAGAEIRWNTDVTGWRSENGRITAAQTPKGYFKADEFVLAGGSWSPETLRNLHVRLPMQAGKGYSMTLTKPRQLPKICSIFTEARVAVTPMGGSLRFGGTMEITGADLSVNRRRVKGIVESIPSYFPEFTPEDFQDQPVWTGLRPCSPDGLPYIGRLARHENLIVAAGHSMMGMSLGPVTGRLVSSLLSDEAPDIDISALSPDRYA